MSAWHRRRGGRYALIYPRVKVEDGLGNEQFQPDMNATPWRVPVSGQSDRASRAEVPGQQTLEYINIQVPYNRKQQPHVWGAVKLSSYPGDVWDVTAPPELRWGTRHVRHLTVNLRKRP